MSAVARVLERIFKFNAGETKGREDSERTTVLISKTH